MEKQTLSVHGVVCGTEEPQDQSLAPQSGLGADESPPSAPSCSAWQTAGVQGWPGGEMRAGEDDRGGKKINNKLMMPTFVQRLKMKQ